MFVLRIDLSTRPEDIDTIAQDLSDCLKAAGVQSWLTEPAYADPVYPIIWVGWIHGSTAPQAIETFTTTSAWWSILFPIIAVIGAFILIPGLAELLNLIMMFAVMYLMMYMMTSMMSGMYPELKPVRETQYVPIAKAKTYLEKHGPGAYARLKELADKGAELAPDALAELKSLAGKGVGWAVKAWRYYRGRG